MLPTPGFRKVEERCQFAPIRADRVERVAPGAIALEDDRPGSPSVTTAPGYDPHDEDRSRPHEHRLRDVHRWNGGLGRPGSREPAAESREPLPGDPGKDVIFVPTPPTLVEKMLDMARVTPADFVVDLGSGDGRIVIMAAQKYRADATGIEMVDDLYHQSMEKIRSLGLQKTARIIHGEGSEVSPQSQRVGSSRPSRQS